MSITIQPYGEEHVGAVKAFNARLRDGGMDLQFPESHVPGWLPRVEGREIYHDYYLAVDDQAVRGGYIFKHQPFFVGDQMLPLCEYRLPLSEGQVDHQFASVGVQIYLDAMRKQSRLYTVGIGGMQEAAAQMLVRAGWNLWPVPFFFRVLHPSRFLRQIVYLRSTPQRRLALDALAYSGLGWLGVHAYQGLKAGTTQRDPDWTAPTVDEFGSWADDIWQASHTQYKMIALRDRTILNILYPASDPRWIRLAVRSGNQVVGWATLLNTPMQGHNFFGDMRVGSIIDCLALPGMERKVSQAALAHLRSGAADVVVTNLSHRAWQESLRASGFLEGPSNFIFAASKAVSALLGPFDESKLLVHMTRGDGGGPQNLLAARERTQLRREPARA